MHRLPMYQHHCLARLLHSTRRALIILLALALLLAGIGVAGQVFFCLGPPLPRALAAGAGLEVGRIDLIEGRPEYLRFAAPTDLLGWLSARVVNRVPGLVWWRVLWVVAWRKPG